MFEFLSIMAAPFAASLILTGVHAYLGLHVVRRGVIFVDIALAQIAALGATIAFLFGMDIHGAEAYWVSLGFTLIGALIFSVTRSRRARIPQEAFIGIVYAVSAAAAILVVDRAPGGAEHVKDILVGSLLFVQWTTVVKTAILYGVIGLLHYLWRKPLWEVSETEEWERGNKRKPWLWDLFFYGTFGFVVTSSVGIAGVLLVFSYLVVPAVCAMLLVGRTDTGKIKVGKSVSVAWLVGILVSVVGCYFSYFWDLPTGAAIVVTFGGALIIIGVIRKLLLVD
jgi:zinc/manganese transport system permease protein